MAENYRFAVGHGIAFASMTLVTTVCRNNPHSIGIRYPEIIVGISPYEFPDGAPHTEWMFTAGLMSQMLALRTAFGLSITVLSAPVTIYTLKEFTTYARYNAMAHAILTNDGYRRLPEERGVGEPTFRFTELAAL